MGRWSDYVLGCGADQVAPLWAAAAEGRRSIYVVGEGFDPRMLDGPRLAAETGALGDETTIVSLGLGEPGGRPSPRAVRAREQVEQVAELAAAKGWEHRSLPYPQVNERRFLGRELLAGLVGDDSFKGDEHVVIDVSALPTSVYFGLIGGLLQQTAAQAFKGELQVVVAENVEIDSLIGGRGTEDAPAPIVGYGFGVELDARADRPLIVWAPVLGPGAGAQLVALAQRLSPNEICPVLPFPAQNPRRADDLLLDLRELLVDSLSVEPSNYIYADEANPFDLYRALGRLHDRYGAALKPVGDAQVVLSIHSSKTLSLGALLAGFENRLPVINAEPEHYDFDDSAIDGGVIAGSELTCLWLEGTPTA